LLFKAKAHAIADTIEIKCRRCGTINALRPADRGFISNPALNELSPERSKRPETGEVHCGSIYQKV